MFPLRCLHKIKHVLYPLGITDRLLTWRTTAAVKAMTTIHADPSTCLVDDKTRYSVEGLAPEQNITVAAVLKEENATYISHAHYIADSRGGVDLSQDISLGGSFTGKEPMGLLWAMKPEKGSKSGVRLHKKDATVPFDITFSVLNEHCELQNHTDIEDHVLLCKMSHPRTYMGPGVRRILVREGRLRGALYLPTGDGPFPGVLDLFGTAGGLTEFRSALLASRGFASFALAYFNYDDLDKQLSWDMEYFEEAVDFLTTHPDVNPGGIATIAVSKGTELISYMAIYSPLVKAVVSIGALDYYALAEHRKNGKKLPTVMPDWGHMVFDPEGIVLEDAYLKAEVPSGTEIEIEKAEGAEFLFITGEDDRCVSTKHTDVLIERLKKHGKQNYRLLRYSGAGHLIEPPYTPHAKSAYHKIIGREMLFGGNTRDHALAQEHSWREILAFFKHRLNVHVDEPPTSKL